MTRIIFYTDIHHGDVMKALRDSSVNILGPFAIPMQMALNAYAEREEIITLLHGGDETTSIRKPKYPREYLDVSKKMLTVMNAFSGHVIRAIGNHVPIDYIDELRFPPSGLIKGVSNCNLNVALYQPVIEKIDGKTIYDYHPERLSSHFNDREIGQGALIAMGHFAFDRPAAGFPPIHPPSGGYAYQENSELIRAMLQEKEIANSGSVLSLHGHEHRFRLTAAEGFRCLTMPSIVQEDPLNKDRPCGLFVEIDINDSTGELTFAFKQIHLNEDNPESSKVETVSQKYMRDNYYRPYIQRPQAA